MNILRFVSLRTINPIFVFGHRDEDIFSIVAKKIDASNDDDWRLIYSTVKLLSSMR